MRAGLLSSASWSFAGARPIAEPKETVLTQYAPPAPTAWNRETFADEQIRGLVRQIFSSGLNPPVQQVVFNSVDPETDVRSLCRWVGEVLAQEKSVEIAVIDETDLSLDRSYRRPDFEAHSQYRTMPIRQLATRIYKNVWWVPPRSASPDSCHRPSLSAYMAELRREFEYSIVAAPASTVSSLALEMARFADGIILVLSAQHTRRVTALKVKNAMGRVRLLGTVLSDREFPMPTSIYRRL
ncbi:MAG TPA: hypothetical protein VJP02_19295 [Candidatus Sulfotelmatobacter sp.]|nr:hypothetical protein [Candidatus Sulfotelmatobacter sp.]